MAVKRSIFEEVNRKDEGAATAPGSLIDRARPGAPRGIRIWLLLLFLLVTLMITIGGMTRLTDSGLSITEWKPVTGAIPPMNTEDWEAEFELYQQIPQYELMNEGMTLSEFQTIYWWEWGHRQLGRVIGLVWALGFFGFLLTRNIPPGWTGRLIGIGALGGLQGAIGWWMVSSGLGGEALSVASYRLAVHLGLAFGILGTIAWFVLRLGRRRTDLLQARRARERKLWGMSTGLMHLAFVQILIGALVAGIDAGRTYTDWPLMAGGFLPPYPFDLEPVWRNFLENPGLVQFIHRMVGYLVAAFAVVVWLRARRSPHPRTRGAGALMAGVMAVQVLLGILTVIYGAPWQLAILHQLCAVAFFVSILRLRFLAGYPAVTSLRGAPA
ncbi:COX15/CtaA family protein [Roseicyclus sp. F158]|uniref:Heme A synthase n=1 Tax=Tropicimonas omnivorans TaxID=3075590 RepID=A0ABU3DJP5_9RHOB|nr:heme A synthase [Roseicyclus sp. F158]MDT0683927.1 COX15/CtaA family protein [Roseicyclus sp. F158]